LPFFFLLNHQSSIELKHSAPVLEVRPEVCAIALFFLLNHQSSIELKHSAPVLDVRPEENTPCVLWRRTPGAPKSPDNSANPQSERYRIGRFGGVYGQSKLSNILHANELAGDLSDHFFTIKCKARCSYRYMMIYIVQKGKRSRICFSLEHQWPPEDP